MHTHDQTLLNRLGFRDPDKSNNLHDLACQYLNEKSVGDALVQNGIWIPSSDAKDNVRYEGAQLERPIFKGSNQYKTHVGFVDAVMFWRGEYQIEEGLIGGPLEKITRSKVGCLYVEVKIQPVPIGDVLRQIRLYESFLREESFFCHHTGGWALVTYYDMCEADVSTLCDNGIIHLRLGENFNNYCAWRKTQQSVPSTKTVVL